MQRELGVSRATLYRDLKILVESPLPVHKDIVNGEARYLLEGDWPAGPPTTAQLLALSTARNMLASLTGTQLVEHLDRLLGQRSAAPSPIAVVPEPVRHRPSDVRSIEEAM